MKPSESTTADQGGRAVQWSLLAITVVATLVTFIDPPYPKELRLQHLPTIVILCLLVVTARYQWLSTTSFASVVVFLWLHILGARWIYSLVPYDKWTQTVAGFSLSEQFGWSRNHYDRFVHFMSGILFVTPFAELLQRYGGVTKVLALVLAVQIVVALGALYEIIEWLLAVFMSPERAEAYNGQQGDIWDPQKDLALALVGGCMAAVWLSGRGGSDTK